MTEQVNEEIEVLSEEKSPRQINIDLIKDVAEAVFPGDWDLSLCEDSLKRTWEESGNGRPTWRLVVRVPEATITNRRGDSHTIKNYHVVLGITDDFSRLATPELKALRTSATTLEAMLGFAHPHNNRSGGNRSTAVSDYFTWRTMCLGGGTELAFATRHMAAEGITEALLTETLLLLRSYAAWESIDGGPYYHIKNVVHEKQDNYDTEEWNIHEQAGSLKKLLLKTLSENPEFLPEVVGDFSKFTANVYRNSHVSGISNNQAAVAITNINNSIVPAFRLILKSVWEELEENRRNTTGIFVTKRSIKSILGHRINDNFTPLATNEGDLKYTVNQYLNQVTEAQSFNGSEQADTILTWGGESAHFEITVDSVIASQLLSEENQEEIEGTINWETIEINDASVTRLTNIYLNVLHRYSSKIQHQTL